MNSNRAGWWQSIPPVTKNLIIINLLIWLVEVIVPNFAPQLLKVLGLHYVGSSLFNPIQIITYMFVHDPSSPLHVFFNMFTLWMFGRTLEMVWGSRRFLLFYFVCGIGAALVQEAVWAGTWMHDFVSALGHANGLTTETMGRMIDEALAANDPSLTGALDLYKSRLVTIGASGAIFGLLLGFAFVFPNMPLYLFFIPVPIKAKYMVIGYGVIEFFLGVSGGGTIAHFAHLGGMIFGFIILMIWKKQGKLGGNYF